MVVAIIIPLTSVARSLPVKEDKKLCPVVVALVRILEEALRVVKLEVEPLKVAPENRVSPRMEELRLMALPEAVVLAPLIRVMMGEAVAVTRPLGSSAKNLPALGPSRNNCPVVVALVRILLLAFRVVTLSVRMLVVEAFKVVPLNKLMPKTLLFKVMLGVVPPEEEMLPLPVTLVTVPL